MPEEFMADQSVPAHWRLLGVLNGFFFNGRDVYASNEWLAEQLKCSTRTVSDAVARLETLKKIRCVRTRTTRVITRWDSSQLLSPSQPTAIRDSSQLLTNADSNADKKIPVPSGTISPFQIVKDKVTLKKPAKDRAALSLREKLYDLFEKEYGHRPTSHSGDYFAILRALKTLKPKQIEAMVEDALDQGKKRTVREVLTARSIDIYLQDS